MAKAKRTTRQRTSTMQGKTDQELIAFHQAGLAMAIQTAANDDAESLMGRYPLICAEALATRKTPKQLMREAMKSYAASLSPSEYKEFYAKLTTLRGLDSRGGDITTKAHALEKRMYGHYSKVLLAKTLGVDLKTHKWSTWEKRCISPVEVSDDERAEARSCFDDLISRQIYESIHNLDFEA